MQRMKGQTNSVPANMREIKEDIWRSQPNQAYGSPITASNIPDPYLSNYYASVHYPCLNQGVGDGAWSNRQDPITYLGGQIGREQPSHYMDGMFNQNNFNNFNQGFSYFAATSNDYQAWNSSSLTPRKTGAQSDNRDDYYPHDLYNQTPYQTNMKHLEHRMEGLSLHTHQNNFQFFKDGYGKSDALTVTESHPNDHHFAKKVNAFPMQSSGVALSDKSTASKKLSWASIASKPAKSQSKTKSKAMIQPQVLSSKHNSNSMDIGTWENKNGNNELNSTKTVNKLELSNTQGHSSNAWNSPRGKRHLNNQFDMVQSAAENSTIQPMLTKLCTENNYNPKNFDLNPKSARFFIIKSYSEDDVHRSIKYSIWCSTEHGNKRLDAAFRENEGKGPVYLLYSVNGSGHFCGMAEMVSRVDYNSNSNIWAQDKWKGQFKVKWIYVKDVPNSQLRHIRLENNDNKPVTNSRDTQEVPLDKGKQMLKIIHNHKFATSIFDDFYHYEKRQQEEEEKKKIMTKEGNSNAAEVLKIVSNKETLKAEENTK